MLAGLEVFLEVVQLFRQEECWSLSVLRCDLFNILLKRMRATPAAFGSSLGQHVSNHSALPERQWSPVVDRN